MDRQFGAGMQGLRRNRVSRRRVLGTVSGALIASVAPRVAGAQPSGSPAPASDIATQLWSVSGEAAHIVRPGKITIAPDGTLWIADLANSRFILLDPDGAFLEFWGEQGSEPGQFSARDADYDFGDQGLSIAFTDDGAFLVADANQNAILRFSADRRFEESFGGEAGLNHPMDITVGDDGNIYVCDELSSRIVVFSPDGTVVRTFGEAGRDAGQMTGPTGISFAPDGTIWVADQYGNLVHHFEPDGAFIASYGTSGNLDRPLQLPIDIAHDAAGRVYVTEYLNKQVTILAADGEPLGWWGNLGYARIVFSAPTGVAFDEQGFMYVADLNLESVQKFEINLPPAT